jgi:hypothetical protein
VWPLALKVSGYAHRVFLTQCRASLAADNSASSPSDKSGASAGFAVAGSVVDPAGDADPGFTSA